MLITLFNILLLFITINSVLRNTTLYSIYPFVLEVSVNVLMLISILLLKKSYFNKENISLLWPIKLFLIWNFISFARGLFVAENYWEWKHLFATGFVFAIPLFVYVFTSKLFIQKVISFWIRYTLPWFLFLLFFMIRNDLYGTYLAPFLLLILLFPILPLRWKILSLLATMLVMTGFGSRSNIIRFVIANLLGFSYYYRYLITIHVLRFVHGLLILLPIVLLLLGLTHTFNPFKIHKYIKTDLQVERDSNSQLQSKEDLGADTRTPIYVENITSALKHDYVFFGRTPANGYDSKSFGNYLKYLLQTGKMQRFSSEVSILNIFTWSGLVGVVLYFLVFFIASFLAVYRSNSYFIKIVGLFVAFRWSYAFVEDFTSFDIQYIMLWLFISMCYSIEFRKMSDLEFKNWIYSIFQK